MFFRFIRHYRSLKQDKKEIGDLFDLLKKHGCEVICFEYNRKAFGDLVLKFIIDGQELLFSTDRGDIYYNNIYICGRHYMRTEKKTIVKKVTELVKLKIISIKNGEA